MTSGAPRAMSRGPHRIKVLFFESGREGGSVFRLASIVRRIDRSRFEPAVAAYYRDHAAAVLYRIDGVFCRTWLRVPWHPQPDTLTPGLGRFVPMRFGIYLLPASLLLLRRPRPHLLYLNTDIGGFEPTIAAARRLGAAVVCQLRMSRELKAHEIRFANQVSHLVTSSEWAARFYERQTGTAATCVYEAIDLDEFDARARPPLERALPDGPVYVCQVGSLIARKRPHLAVAAIAIARERIPSLKLVLVGDGPEAARLDALARERGLEDAVLRLGRRRDVPAILRRCHIGLLLSEHEGLPNAVLEYMAGALPVVAAR